MRFARMLAFPSLIAAATLSACATAPVAGAPPETALSVVDEGGASIPGTYLLRGQRNDRCTTSGASCSVTAPEGDYTLTFVKAEPGRLQLVGIPPDHLAAFVHLVPGQTIACKKTAEFGMGTPAPDTMDCGVATQTRAGRIGVLVGSKADGIYLTHVFPKSPAHAAGLLAGDRVVAIDGAPVLSVSDAQSRISGTSGTTVTLTLVRKGETLSLQVKRAS